MSAPTYRIVSSKVLENGEVLVKVATEDGKYRTRRIKPAEGGGILRYYAEVHTGLHMVIMEHSWVTNGALFGQHFYVSDKTRVREIVALVNTLPRIRPAWEPLHEQHHLNAAD